MAFQVRLHEGTERPHPEASRADVVERRRNEPAGNSLAFELRLDLGVDEDELIVLLPVVDGPCELAVDDRLVPLQLGVVPNGHPSKPAPHHRSTVAKEPLLALVSSALLGE